ncbi:MAG: nitroreductase/quinone reductase family protein [Dehalococcoidia bacterium]
MTAHPWARVEVMGRTFTVHAEQLSMEEAADFWPRVLQAAPDYARYPRRTSRSIPLMRLVSRTSTSVTPDQQVRPPSTVLSAETMCG